MTPLWMAFRGEVSEYTAVTQVYQGSCCDVTGSERKARRYLEGLQDSAETAVCEHSLARCIKGVAGVFCSKGGCDNTKSERLISVLTF